jgi:toxin-antitoxin system PIN domain toxin
VILPDASVLVYAYREDAPRHAEYHAWLDGVVNGDAAYGLSGLVLAGFLRLVTDPRMFASPSPLPAALGFVRALASPPNRVEIAPGPRHWAIFARLCEQADARGERTRSAYLAALAIESGCEWITTDRSYARFPGLRWRHPLDAGAGPPAGPRSRPASRRASGAAARSQGS